VIWRNPHEDFKNWQQYARPYGREVELDRSLCIDKWLERVSLTISSFSTVTIDSIAQGMPSISLQNIIPPRFINVLPEHRTLFENPYSWNPHSVEEAMDLIEKARAGCLKVSPRLDEARKFMRDNFNFPRDKYACELIAQGIADVYESSKKRASGKQRVCAFEKKESHFSWKSFLKGLIVCLPGGKRFIVWVSYIMVYLNNPREENLYFPFKRRHMREAKQYTRKLFNKKGNK